MKWDNNWKYRVSTMGIINGQIIWEGYPAGYAAEKKESFRFNVTWENLAEFYRYFGMSTPISLWNFKKGHYFELFHGNWSKTWKYHFLGLKQWKHPLQMIVIFSYQEI